MMLCIFTPIYFYNLMVSNMLQVIYFDLIHKIADKMSAKFCELQFKHEINVTAAITPSESHCEYRTLSTATINSQRAIVQNLSQTYFKWADEVNQCKQQKKYC